MVKAQQWVNENFSSQENKDKVKKLCIRLKEGTNKIDQSNYEFFNTKLEGELDLNGFKNLEDLAIWGNWTSTLHPITNLKIDRCSKLQKLEIDCTSFDKLNLNSNQKITTLIIRGCINLQKIEGLEQLSNLQNLNLWPSNSVPNSKLQISLSQNNWKPEIGRIKEIQVLKEKAQQLKELADIILPNITFDLDKLKQEIARLRLNELVPQVQKKKSELEQQINNTKNSVETSFKKVIDLLLETQKQIITGKKDPLVQAQFTGQLNAYLSILEGNLSKQELQALLDKKTELIKMEEQIDKLQRTKNKN
ncbi:hypothetical protein RhiirA4_438731 [Rhizophagus irregularis]|uniref:Uncharacterized protein n=1 Tax=Rhizophagus irregularis TaxID=588596 RepID=A0A2I1FT36_9GLOM|nr:hypothetical protein RhiirA4_438731 [Rhizophagus irregularis]